MADAEFNLWNGTTRIIRASEMEERVVSIEKFDTCKHRSAEEEVRVHKSCCSSYEAKGFVCYRRGIFGLDHVVCEQCPVYERKTEEAT